MWARWPAAPTHTFAASYDIVTPSGTQTAVVNQRIDGGRWHLLKTITLAANDNWSVELSDQSPGEVVADAVAITSPLTLTDRFDWSPTLPSAGEYAVYAKWQAAADRATDATYEITHSNGVDEVTVDQTHNGGEWRYLGTWSFDPNQSPKVSLLASLNGTVNADAVRFVSGDAIGGKIAYSHGDQLGTIQKLTDASGTLIWDRIARPFGETVSINAASGIEQKLRFAGQFADETGLSYNYFRDYDPTLGRYAQSDPIGLDGGINTYAYVAGNPINYTDPTGEIIPQLIGFAIGAGLEYLTNPCATIGDLLIAGAIGAVGGGFSKVALLRFGPRSLTRITGKEWSHSIPREMVNRYTSGPLKKALNRRGGLNGSWTSPRRAYKHDGKRWPVGWRNFGDRWPPFVRPFDRVPDWLKGAAASGGIGSAVAGSDCACASE